MQNIAEYKVLQVMFFQLKVNTEDLDLELKSRPVTPFFMENKALFELHICSLLSLRSFSSY